MEWDEWVKKDCNVLTTPIEQCCCCIEYEDCRRFQSWFTKIPFFIIDQMQRKLSPVAFRIFVYLNRRANFDKGSDHYGMCWVNYSDIEKATGIKKSNMWKYMNELESNGVIRHNYETHYIDGTFKTSHTFIIEWVKKLEEFKSLVEVKAP